MGRSEVLLNHHLQSATAPKDPRFLLWLSPHAGDTGVPGKREEEPAQREDQRTAGQTLMGLSKNRLQGKEA